MFCKSVLPQQLIGSRFRHASNSISAIRRPRGRPRKESICVVEASEEPTENHRCAKVAEESHDGAQLMAESGLKSKKQGKLLHAKDSKETRRTLKDAEQTSSFQNGSAKVGQASAKTKVAPEPRPPRLALIDPALNHHDMATFLEYVSRMNLNMTTSVYKGTYFEYLAAEVLKRYNFRLQRTGQVNDLGVDLIGCWHLPRQPHELNVLIQCKASKPTPAMIRELEGAYVGAPAGWRGEGVLGILVATQPATEGVRDALQRSRLSLCFVQITSAGNVLQFLWNSVAQQSRLAGLSVTMMYGTRATTNKSKGHIHTEEAVSLLWMGRHWKGGLPVLTNNTSSLRPARSERSLDPES